MRKLLVSCAALGLVLAACSGGDDSSDAAADGGTSRYCELNTKLEAAADTAFGGLTQDSSEDEVANAFRNFLDANEDDINAYTEAAPQEIKAELTTLIDAQRDVAESGDLSQLESGEIDAADAKVQAFDDENCG
jgi:ABC-type glycerol-3-phosphate transport system substrate-binding protein